MTSLDLARAVLVIAASIGAGCGSATSSPSDGNAARDAAAGGSAGGSAGGGGGSMSGTGGSYGSGAGGTQGAVGSDCRRSEDCDGASALCLAPGESPGCGVCKQPTAPCNADGDCAARGPVAICERDPCSCSDAKSCVTGCMDASGCGTGEFCAANHRCAPNVCAPGDRSCLPNFACGGDGQCTRKACEADDDCDGACVKQLCHSRPGTCTPPPV